MSFYTDASLVLIPSGIKDQKVYCAKPVDGSGDLTFTRSNDTATRVGSDGLIEKVRTNYLRYSQDFSQWTLFGGATRTTGVTDPNGGTTAATISNLSSGNFDQGLVLNSNPMTIGSEPIVGSIWLKGTGTMAIYLERSVSGTYFFYSQEITLTSTWTRYQVTGATAGSRGGFSFGVSNFVGSTATSVDIAFGQTEFGDVPTNYIATTTAAVSVGPVANLPRLDYLGSSCPSLLLEPQRTNLATYSEQANQYTKIEATIGSNVLTSPDGYTNADSLIEDGTTDIHAFYNFGLTTFTAAAYTASIFAKKGGRDWFALQLYHGSNHIAYFNLNTGAVGTISAGATATITNYGNGWYRCTITATTTANAGGIAIYSANADNSITYAGTNGLAAGYFYGLQLELGAYATSYIPTLGSAVTRGADSASKTGIASLIGQSEGVIFLDFIASAQNADGLGFSAITIFGDSTDNFQIYTIGTALYWYAKNSSGVLIDQTANQTLVAGQRYKIAYAYKSGDWALYINGVQKRTNTAAAVPAVSQFNFNGGGYAAAVATVKNDFSQTLLFTTRLSNDSLATLTA
jgi:hypothetical protein